MIQYIATIRKALIPLAVASILALLAQLGIGGELTIEEAVTALVTGFFVWLIPNQNGKVKVRR